jgi:hypothetical protein
VRDITRRFRLIQRIIRYAIVDADILGLSTRPAPVGLPTVLQEGLTFEQALAHVQRRMFAFSTSQQKVAAFMDWLDDMEARSILQVSRGAGAIPGRSWADTYVDHAYQRGIRRGRQELIRQGADIPGFDPAAGEGPVRMAMNQPIHAEQVGLLYTRVFNELVGIDAAMDQAIGRELAEGLAAGWGPARIARRLAGPDGVMRNAVNRARMIARTEVVRAHHIANITEYRQWGAVGVKVKAEWATAGYGVCPVCEALEEESKQNPFTLDEIYGLIPAHPNCRCVAIPILQEPKKVAPPPRPVPPVPVPTPTPVPAPGAAFATAPAAELEGMFYQDLGINYLETTGYTTKGATELARGTGTHIAEMYARFPALEAAMKARRLTGGLELWNESVLLSGDGRSLQGFYRYGGGQSPMIRIGTKGSRKVNSLRIGGRDAFVVSTDYYSTLRHELAHHFQKSMELSRKRKWLELWADSGKKNYFQKKVSFYSGTDSGEAFAEAFSAYTSPLYGTSKTRLLPKQIEAFFKEWLG